MQTPKLFISYSWSSPDHEQWVLDLAGEIVQSGVEVILDKWDLREGHDSVAFMEKMVTDPSITKVLMICDRVYADKADGRAGGVGTETQIISPNVYEKRSQDKFVAVVVEKDEAGKACLPTYYKSRIYIDLSESDRYAEGFEKLLRWIFDKPVHVKPPMGKPPAFLTDPLAPTLGTAALAKRAIDAFRADKSNSLGVLGEYLTLFATNLEAFRIWDTPKDKGESLIRSIEEFSPSRNEFVSVVTTLAQYGGAMNYGPRLHRFFESLIPYFSHPPQVNTWNEVDFDNFRFIIHELFLYTLAVLIREEHFEVAEQLLAQPYYAPSLSSQTGNATATYAVFRDHLDSLETWNQNLSEQWLSPRATLLEQRSKTAGVPFEQVMQADFICFVRAELLHKGRYDNWFPETLLFAIRHHGPFEVFARSVSRAYLNRALPLLGVASLTDVKQLLDGFTTAHEDVPRWGYRAISPSALLGFDQLGSRA